MFKKVRQLFLNLIRSHANVEDVARGFALGAFISASPLLGIHTLLALGLAALFRISKLAAYLGVWVINPFIVIPTFWLCFRIGQWILKKPALDSFDIDKLHWKHFFTLGGDFILALTLGCTLFGIVLAAFCYFLAKKFYPILQKKFGVEKKGETS